MVGKMTMYGQEQYNQISGQFHSNHYGGKMHYFVMAVVKGRWVDIGCYESEAQATEAAYREAGDKHWEIFATDTSNIAEAHRRWKKRLLQRGSNLDEATSLISRKPAMDKKKKEKTEWVNEQECII